MVEPNRCNKKYKSVDIVSFINSGVTKFKSNVKELEEGNNNILSAISGESKELLTYLGVKTVIDRLYNLENSDGESIMSIIEDNTSTK